MPFRSILAALASIAGVVSFTVSVQASEVRSWYVYCEGTVNGKASAIFSANVWPHVQSNSYQSSLAAAAQSYIAGSPGTKLSGCAGVGFLDQTVATYNRERTAEFARGVGDTVYYVDMPPQVLPE
jgi:hypothetical protein